MDNVKKSNNSTPDQDGCSIIVNNVGLDKSGDPRSGGRSNASTDNDDFGKQFSFEQIEKVESDINCESNILDLFSEANSDGAIDVNCVCNTEKYESGSRRPAKWRKLPWIATSNY